MEINRIKIEGYIFEKDETGIWTCRNHNLMTGDIKWINEIMPKLKDIEKLFRKPTKEVPD